MMNGKILKNNFFTVITTNSETNGLKSHNLSKGISINNLEPTTVLKIIFILQPEDHLEK
jgi:hypothetical protein